MRDFIVQIAGVVIPPEVRRGLGLRQGDAIVVRCAGDELPVLPREEAVRRAKAIVGGHTGEGRPLVDELISGRRVRADRE